MDDDELWRRFARQEFSHAEWTHAMHVRTAFLHLARYDLDEAHLRMRAGIIRLNERHGLEETTQRGYFETMTRAWLHLVGSARRRTGAVTSLELLEKSPELMDRGLPLRHYSKAVLMSPRARAIFVDADLEPLPLL
jgi:hypothetical protein